MDTAQFTGKAEYVLELVGIVAFALSGAMLAIRKDFDVVGITLLAGIAALGGGVMRDLLIGTTPPAAFEHVDYLVLAAVTASVAVFVHPALDRLRRPVLLLDALGLAVFTVNGTLLASEADSEVYAIPSAFGALIVAVAHLLDAYSAVIGVLAAVIVFGLRATAMSIGWRAPGAHRRSHELALRHACMSI
jgi:uncharacterized membrane protein YeiH